MTIGLNVAGAEFGGARPGIHNQDYHYPEYAELKFYRDNGVKFIRLPFAWERAQRSLGGALDFGEMSLMKRVLTDAAALGLEVMPDCHSYGRYNGLVLNSPGGPTSAQFADFWKKMALELKSYPGLVAYDTMNEPNNMGGDDRWPAAAQAAANAILSVDTAHDIHVEGDHWGGAHSWSGSSNARLNIVVAPEHQHLIVYHAHQYPDRDSSGAFKGTYDADGVTPTTFADRIKGFVTWLNGRRGFIGEFNVPSVPYTPHNLPTINPDPRWLVTMKNGLDYLKANNLGGTVWAGGHWWHLNSETATVHPSQTAPVWATIKPYLGAYPKSPVTAADPAPPPPPPPVVEPTPEPTPAPAPAPSPATATAKPTATSRGHLEVIDAARGIVRIWPGGWSAAPNQPKLFDYELRGDVNGVNSRIVAGPVDRPTADPVDVIVPVEHRTGKPITGRIFGENEKGWNQTDTDNFVTIAPSTIVTPAPPPPGEVEALRALLATRDAELAAARADDAADDAAIAAKEAERVRLQRKVDGVQAALAV
jgi:endoglucanase